MPSAIRNNDGVILRRSAAKDLARTTQPSAHYEHTLVVTKGEPILLTAA
jgi:methionine aminopeptidase